MNPTKNFPLPIVSGPQSQPGPATLHHLGTFWTCRIWGPSQVRWTESSGGAAVLNAPSGRFPSTRQAKRRRLLLHGDPQASPPESLRRMGPFFWSSILGLDIGRAKHLTVWKTLERTHPSPVLAVGWTPSPGVTQSLIPSSGQLAWGQGTLSRPVGLSEASASWQKRWSSFLLDSNLDCCRLRVGLLNQGWSCLLGRQHLQVFLIVIIRGQGCHGMRCPRAAFTNDQNQMP